MSIVVLGPVGVEKSEGDVEVLGPRLQRLLAALVIDRHAVVSVDRLTDIVWQGEPPSGAEGTLRSYVTRLRQALELDDALVRRGVGYVLNVDDSAVDAARFESELAAGLDGLRTGDLGSAAALLDTALGRWRGRPFGDLGDEDWARPERIRLEERLVEARAAQIDVMLADGRTRAAIAVARALAAEQPLREQPHGLLMRALYASGAQAEALRAFADFRARLADETGLDPSTELVELERRILADDVSVGTRQGGLRSYELGERIGSGRHGVVRRASQLSLGRDVAIKIIRPELADHPEFVRRFEHEARLVARVEHPHVVPLYDFWREPGAAYLIMRLMVGGSVASALRRSGPYSFDQLMATLDEIGGALSEAHRLGVVHRDLRPDNLLLDRSGRSYLSDFGIGRSATIELDDSGIRITDPHYAAPELLRGDPGGVTADVLSFALSTFEMLTGRVPFADSEDLDDVVRQQINRPLPPARALRTDLPEAVDEVLAIATSKAAADRHQSIEQFVEDMRAAFASQTVSTRLERVPARNPYVGLHAFDEADADRFFGRERTIGELTEAVRRQPFVAVIGPSGSGKSSVVRAGLIPAIRRGAIPGSERWFVTSMTPGADPISAFEAALLRVAVQPPAGLRDRVREPGGLLSAVRRVVPTGDRLVVVIDQFEELFIHATEPLRRTFLDELAQAVAADNSPLGIVATIRADHYDAPLRHRSIAMVMRAGTIPIQPMEPDELRRAIVEPARHVGVDVESSLTAELVAEVSAEPGTLPLLQFSLTELFERRTADVMRQETHRELGGLAGSIAARADRILAPDEPGDVAAARLMFARLITLEHDGAPRARRALRSEVVRDERSAWLLDAFIKGRLLTTDADPDTRQPVVSIAHEALIEEWPRLRAWVDEDRDDLRTVADVGRRTSAWLGADRDGGELARGHRLAIVEELAGRRPDLLTADEHEWVSASGAEERRRSDEVAAAAERDRSQNRRLRRSLAGVAALFALAALAAVVAFVSQNRADDAAEAAEIDRLIAVSASQIESRPDLAILLALEAHRRAPAPNTLTSVHRAIATNPRIVSIYDASSAPALTPDGSIGLVELDGEDVPSFGFIDAGDGTPIGEPIPVGVGHRLMKISGDGRVGAVYLEDNTIAFLSTSRPTPTGRYELGELGLYDLALDGSGDLAAIVAGNTLELVDVASQTVLDSRAFDIRPDEGYRIWAKLSPEGMGMAVLLASDGSEAPDRYDVEIVDTASLEVTERFVAEGPSAVDVVFGDDGRLILGHADGVARVYDAVDRAVPQELGGLLGSVEHVAVNRRGDIAGISDEGTVRLWREGDPATATEFDWAGVPADLALDEDGTMTIATYDRPEAVVSSGPAAFTLRELDSEGGAFVDASLPFFADAAPGSDTLTIRSLDDGSAMSSLDASEVGGTQWYVPVFGAPGGERVLALTFTDFSFDTVVVFDPEDADDRHVVDFEDVRRAMGVTDFPQATVSVRPGADGDRLLAVVTDETSTAAVSSLSLPDLDVLAGPLVLDDFSPLTVLDDGRAIMTVGSELVVLPANLDRDPASAPLGGPHEAHSIDNDGRVLLLSEVGEIVLFDPDDNTVDQIAAWDVDGFVYDAMLSPDGSTTALALLDGTLQFVDTESGEPIGIAVQVDGSIPGVRWASDGSGVWYSVDGRPTLIAGDPSAWPDIACGIVHRDLTAEEWRRFVDPDTEPVSSCG